MATATGSGQGKTGFIMDVLAKNKQANAQAVNEAWADAGNEGKISTTLVQKIRSQLGLTGNLRKGRRPGRGKATSERSSFAIGSRGRGTSKAAGNGLLSVSVHEIRPAAQGGDRTEVLTRIEGEIDEMIFEVKGVGGLQEFEETLRRARRILARSHSE